MIAFADTNWLVASYFDRGEQTELVRRFHRRMAEPPIHVGPVQLFECESVFRRLAVTPDPPSLRTLKADLGRLVIEHRTEWRELVAAGQDLLSRFAHRVPLSAFDAAILAQARQLQADWFLGFDSGSALRAVAHRLRLRLFPELGAADRRWLSALA